MLESNIWTPLPSTPQAVEKPGTVPFGDAEITVGELEKLGSDRKRCEVK